LHFLERENSNLSTNLPFYGMLWASAMAGYTENGNREAKQRKSCGFTPELGHMRTQTPFQYYPRYGVAQQQRPLSPRARAMKKGHYKQSLCLLLSQYQHVRISIS
jgi:hypothetical protein